MKGSRPRFMMLGFIGSIVGLTLISDISNISRVFISNLVGDNLGTAIGKIYTVFSIGSITITVFVLFKVGTRIVISNSILITIDGRGVIGWLLVAMDWLVNQRGRVVHWSSMDNRLVDHWGWLVDWCSMHKGLVNHWGGVIDWGWVVRSRVSI